MDEKSAMERETSQLVQCELIFSDMSEVKFIYSEKATKFYVGLNCHN